MSVAAHPDDVDYATLTYYRKRLGARAVVVLATRGEGTDSPTRAEIDRELGLVRTREAIEAARVTGADLYFLNLRDFGYSKSAEEALSVWGHDEALKRLITAIRLLRPDVIITSHDSKTGDGQHQALARLTLEAFDAAADAKSGNPQSGRGAGSVAWQTHRLFRLTDETNADVIVNLSEYDQVRGRTYAEIGRAARLKLASYGAATVRATTDGEKIYYKLVMSATGEKIEPGASLLDNIALPENLARSIRPPFVGDLTVTEAIAKRDSLIAALREKLEEKRVEGTPQDLHERYGAQFLRVIRFTESLERSLALALGLELQITLSDKTIIPGQKVVLKATIRNGSDQMLPVVFHAPESLSIGSKQSGLKMTDALPLAPRGSLSKEFEYEAPKDAPSTLPRDAHLYDEQYYPIGSSLPAAVGDESFGNSLLVIAEAGLGQVSIPVAAQVRFDVAPPVEISTIPFALVKDWSAQRDFEFAVRVRNRTPGALAGALWVVPLALSDDKYEPAHLSFAREDEEITIRMKLRLPLLRPPLATDILIEFRRERPAPPDPLGSARIAVKNAEFEVAEGLRVGYIEGIDSWLRFALNELGVKSAEIKADEIKRIEHGNAVEPSARDCLDLARFDTVIVDERAYFFHSELIAANSCLLKYIQQGGNLVVLSQEPDDLNLITSRAPLAPYAVKLSKDRITQEAAQVKILDENHLLMSKPNRVTAKDFESWATERAFNVPREWASDYTALLETNDAGEEPTRGTLLLARYGEGSFILTTLSLRRQLLELNAGAYRLFANLISFPKVVKAQASPQ